MFIVNGVSGALLHCINFRVATDPACGSGNFLTETYLELRRLENRALSIINKGQAQFVDVNLYDPIKVKLDQFYGIEINDFAVAVANTALFISEYQMLRETEAILNIAIDYLPLHSFNGIHEGNALRMNWNNVLPSSKCNYVMGNPPFLGYSQQSSNQKKDLKSVLVDERGKAYPRSGKLDFVSGWFYKAASYIQETNIEVAFVATNSITQGDQVAPIWKPLIKRFGIKINFAYQSFIWNNGTVDSAHVHVVIIGFSSGKNFKQKKLYSDSNIFKTVEYINPYLMDAPSVFIESRSVPISKEIPKMVLGSIPRDNGQLLLSDEEYEEYIRMEPQGKKLIKPLISARTYLNNIKRWCFWLVDISPEVIKKCPILIKRIKNVKEFREASTRKGTREGALRPTQFNDLIDIKDNYLVIPRVSSENRRYLPIGFLEAEYKPNDSVLAIPKALVYHFGILSSNVHMSFIRAFAGRLKSDYRYSKDIVYNNFPWPEPNEEQRKLIEKTAQNILDIRSKYPESSLADLYDELLMPQDLRQAHRENDIAVMKAYGWNWKNMSEEDCVAELMKLYQEKVTE